MDGRKWCDHRDKEVESVTRFFSEFLSKLGMQHTIEEIKAGKGRFGLTIDGKRFVASKLVLAAGLGNKVLGPQVGHISEGALPSDLNVFKGDRFYVCSGSNQDN